MIKIKYHYKIKRIFKVLSELRCLATWREATRPQVTRLVVKSATLLPTCVFKVLCEGLRSKRIVRKEENGQW